MRYTATLACMDIRMLERRLRALANGRRLQILQELKRRRSATVGTVAKSIHLTLKATSKHLQILANVDIVRRRKRGLHVIYRLALKQEEPMESVLRLL